MAGHIICFVSFRFVSFRFVSFRFDLFRFVSICFVSFRFVSFRFDLFRFVSFRFCFVSHFTGTRWQEGKQLSCEVFFFNILSWRTLASFGHNCVPMHTNLFNILCVSPPFCLNCQGKRRDIVYRRKCLFLWLISAKHGLFEIQLTFYSALSRLTHLGIYYITRCGIWLLTIFHMP